MKDRKWIYAGLGVFVALILLPTWYDAATPASSAPPELEYPEDATTCVEGTEWIRANHPVLLNEWRNAVVREGQTEFVSSTGAHYTMSLTGTCLECHENRAAFCDRCHEYADVTPTCWDCHVEP